MDPWGMAPDLIGRGSERELFIKTCCVRSARKEVNQFKACLEILYEANLWNV